jgi:large subunit ribosomal protein L29
MKNSFKELKLEELAAKRAELRKKYFDLRFKKVVEHLENPVQLRNLRRQIARLETRIGAAGVAPAAEAEVAAKAKPATRGARAARGVNAAAKK